MGRRQPHTKLRAEAARTAEEEVMRRMTSNKTSRESCCIFFVRQRTAVDLRLSHVVNRPHLARPIRLDACMRHHAAQCAYGACMMAPRASNAPWSTPKRVAMAASARSTASTGIGPRSLPNSTSLVAALLSSFARGSILSFLNTWQRRTLH